MTAELLIGIASIVLLTALLAIPWVIIGRLIGNREDVVSGRPKLSVWGFGRRPKPLDENLETPTENML